MARLPADDDVVTGGFAELDAMDEFGLADLDLDDDWDPVHGNDDSPSHHARSAFWALVEISACYNFSELSSATALQSQGRVHA